MHNMKFTWNITVVWVKYLVYFMREVFTLINLDVYMHHQGFMMNKHWFKWWFGAEYETYHYWNYWISISLTHIYVTLKINLWDLYKKKWNRQTCADFSSLIHKSFALNKSELIMAYWRHIAAYFWVNFGSDEGLLPGDTKPLPEHMLTYHRRCSMAFTLE